MAERRVLVIGSQCEALGELSFLPVAAQDFYDVMTDPDRGSCVSALEEEGLLINPTVQTAKEAISRAYAMAAKDEATLFIAYIGHGQYYHNDFYLLPLNASATPTSETAIHLANLIKEQCRINPKQGVDGLGVLVDACYSGTVAISVGEQWVRDLQAALRFELMTATSADRPAANGCFSRNLTKMLRDGIGDVPDSHLRCVHLRSRLEQACPNQEAPQHPAYNPDETTWLAKNSCRSPLPWSQTPLASEIERLTLSFQPTPNLAEVVHQSLAHPCLAVVGEAGMGKSALAAALAWPEKAPTMVPSAFVQAIVFLNEAQTPQEIARILRKQLCRSLIGFNAALSEFDKITPFAKKQQLSTLDKQVIEPLRLFGPQAEVRIVVDALDRLATGAGDAMMAAIDALTRLPWVHLIVTASQDTHLPAGAVSYLLELASDEQVRLYLNERGISTDRILYILATARGNWLVVRVLADVLCDDSDAALTNGQLALADAFEELLARCGADCCPSTQIVLTLLAAVGAGPVVPLALLCAASERLGGPHTPARLRDELAKLRGLVIRSEAGTESEQVGLFNPALVDHIFLTRSPEEASKAHRALAEAIAIMAPTGTTAVVLADSVQRYAYEREADHLFQVGDIEGALKSLYARQAASPRDNLLRWMSWQEAIFNQLGPDHPDTLNTRNTIAALTAECGDACEALRLFSELLPDQVRELGADHSNTLNTRSSIATATLFCGDVREALRLFSELLTELKPDQEWVLGAIHSSTLDMMSKIAAIMSAFGNPRLALKVYSKLLSDRQRVLGAEDQGTLQTRSNIATLTGVCGDAREALRLFSELLPDQLRVLGSDDHPDTLRTRASIAVLTGVCGDAREALRLLEEVLLDQVRVLGADRSEVLRTRDWIKSFSHI